MQFTAKQFLLGIKRKREMKLTRIFLVRPKHAARRLRAEVSGGTRQMGKLKSAHSVTTCLLALLAVAATGCQTLRPLPIHEPEGLLTTRAVSSGLGTPTDLTSARQTLWAYEAAYGEKADALYMAKYQTDDGSFAGGLLGVVGGLTKSPDTAILGTIIAGGSSTTAQRYSLLIQATNYANAASAMECMSSVLAFPSSNDEIDYPTLAQRISDIRRKLRSSQAQIDLAKTDSSALEAAIKAKLEAIEAQKKAEEEAKKARQKLENALNDQRIASVSRNKSARSVQRFSLLQLAVAQAREELAEVEVEKKDKAREANNASLLKCSTAY